MQRLCSKLQSLAALPSLGSQRHYPLAAFASKHRLIHSSPNLIRRPFTFPQVTPSFTPLCNVPPSFQISNRFPHSPLSFVQVRHITAKQRKRKLKSRKPMTPVTSKVKKVKMKCYSSFKGRFRVMNDGQIRRWKEGKRHNAHSKSKSAKRRLRQPGVVPLAYAKVMKKLNFCS